LTSKSYVTPLPSLRSRQPLSLGVVQIIGRRKLILALLIASTTLLAACGPITVGPVEPNCNNDTCGWHGRR
jgi:hypothetical protein